MIASVKGLRAQQKTYCEDKLIVCELTQLIETVQAKIFEIQQHHPELLTMKDACIVQLIGVKDDEHEDDQTQ